MYFHTISIGNDSLGVSMALTVDALSGTNQIVLSGVQGDFSTNTADTLSYKPTAGVSSALSVYPLSPIDEINNGKEFVVNFRNHGMHSTANVVKLSGLEGTINVKLASTYR